MRHHSDMTGIGGFRSKLARKIALLAWFGFLGSLGFVPGWERLSGCFAFFAFFGLAYLFEFLSRRSRKPTDM